MKNKITLGIIAHVDAGKTTLSEAILYKSGAVNKLGRVDDKNSHFDTNIIEKDRGITVFSKLAHFEYKDTYFTLIDTPGHIDFSTETERALQVMDYAVLVISGTDGIQAHTETLFNLLNKYNIPTFIFVSKMDINTADADLIMHELKTNLSEACTNFSKLDNEEIATLNDVSLSEYIELGFIKDNTISELIKESICYPVYFGSGLKLQGIENFLDGLSRYTREKNIKNSTSGLIYKIIHDNNGEKISFIRLTGGSLKVKDTITYFNKAGDEITEKINQIRLYTGDKFVLCNEALPNTIVAVTGLTSSYPGICFGDEDRSFTPFLEPVLSYRIVTEDKCNTNELMANLKSLEDEDPLIKVNWNRESSDITVQLMGPIQLEVLKEIIQNRFNTTINFDSGKIMYKETIRNDIEGVGHFEPLKHYAEVHLLLSPLPRGSGLIFDSVCSEDLLDRNWQRLIMTHLYEKIHKGILIGAPLTDIKITLIAGKAHPKHTDGGDFRQATYRAVRQGLMKSDSILLEPYYAFSLNLPNEHIGRAMSDIKNMNGIILKIESGELTTNLKGRAPVSKISNYSTIIASYSHGKGRLSMQLDGYEECNDAQNIISELKYNPQSDLQNTPDSVFCSHGSGFNVSWDKVEQYMHIDTGVMDKLSKPLKPIIKYSNYSIDDKELEEIMTKEFGPIRRPMYSKIINSHQEKSNDTYIKQQYMIVDGYNVIFSWDELKDLASDNIDLARHALMDILANYKGFRGCELILVFDAYLVSGNTSHTENYHGINVVFTKNKESADSYIETLVKKIGKNYKVKVVSSDSMIQLSALGSGVLRESSNEFRNEVILVLEQIRSNISRINASNKNTTLGDKFS